jgi:hypothetical protein
MRRRTLRAGAALQDRATVKPDTATPAIAVTLGSTFIRSCKDGERHLERGGPQVFGAVARSDTDIKVLIDRNDAVSRAEGTVLRAFTDGCPGLRLILADAIASSPEPCLAATSPGEAYGSYCVRYNALGMCPDW